MTANGSDKRGMISEGLVREVFNSQKESYNRNTEALQKMAENTARLAQAIGTHPKDTHDKMIEFEKKLLQHHESSKRVFWLVGGGLTVIGIVITLIEAVAHFAGK